MLKRNPDASPSPVDLLSLDHSQLFLRRMKEEGLVVEETSGRQSDVSADYDEIDCILPAPVSEEQWEYVQPPKVEEPKPKPKK